MRAGAEAGDFEVLHAVRLGGFGSTAMVAERAMSAVPTVEAILERLASQGLVEFMDFAGSGGWTLTDPGRDHDAELHAAEMADPGLRRVVDEAAAGFERINPRMVRAVTDWQLATTAEKNEVRTRTIAELDDLYTELDELIMKVVPVAPRYRRYPRQFGAAVARARKGDDDAIASVGTLSCHTVWAELHQDLVSGLGRERR